ncbi:hypothetical protein AS593_04155 [Caulobacter vibrioides]|nr:hypothetical protein AS593_04155 [Caulobacter vibrioides]
MKTRFTPLSIRDLKDIARWIAAERPNAARKVVAKLKAACLNLSDHPYAYPLLAGREDKGVRRMPHGRYAICYRVLPDSVEILRILDGAQDITAQL